MGKEIEKVALGRNHNIIARFDTEDDWKHFENILQGADALIDFSFPETAVNNIYKSFENNIPVIVGTTGWYDRLPEVKKKCLEEEQTLFVSTNFSIGLNIMAELNRKMANLLNRFPEYKVHIEEIHHRNKKDKPSGTAIKLAEDMIQRHNLFKEWVRGKANYPVQLGILSERTGNVPGTHRIIVSSGTDRIIMQHDALSRRGLAEGAVSAAEWVKDKKGVFSMEDLLELEKS